MSQSPIYRLHAGSIALTEERDGKIVETGVRSLLQAGITIPDILPIGSTVEVNIRSINEAGKAVKACALLEIHADGDAAGVSVSELWITGPDRRVRMGGVQE